MTEVDSGLPELHEQDPRLCPGRSDYAEMVKMYGPAPWIGPSEPFTVRHDWGDDLKYCNWCQVTKDQVRDRFRDWRYEHLAAELVAGMKALRVAIERKNW